MLDDPAAQGRTRGCRGGGEAGPQPDRAAAFLRAERNSQDGQTAGSQQSARDALQCTRRDKLVAAVGHAAENGCKPEHRYARNEHATAAEMISQRAANEDERG